MTFNSLDFLLFFPIVVALHHALPPRLRWFFLLIASYTFYLHARVEYGALLFICTLLSYFAGLRMASSADHQTRRRWLAVSLIGNLGMLAGLKYLGLLGAILAQIVPTASVQALGAIDILLPIGISFYTFQAIGYSIDVYRGAEAERHLGMYALYVSFFPQLVAGPIERSRSLLPQLRGRLAWDVDRATSGVLRIAWGFFKKLVIADRLGTYVDPVYADPSSYSGTTLLLATYFFAYQLYCDFSAYSDIAIGSARILGVELMENFRRPFFARSIGEFWRRWHISLTTWFRDYLYLPLARRRTLRAPAVLDFLPLFLLIGLWHGASWTFVLFGLVHGLYMVISVITARQRVRLRRAAKVSPASRLLAPLQMLITFHLLVVSVVFFRAADIGDAWLIFGRIVTLAGPTQVPALGLGLYGLALVASAVLLMEAVQAVQESGKRVDVLKGKVRALRMVGTYALGAATLMFGVFGREEFIYFQF